MSTTEDHLARKTAILNLFLLFPSSQGLGTEAVNAYAVELGGYAPATVKRACERIREPDYPREGGKHWHPSAAELAEVCELIEPRSSGPAMKLVSYPIGGQPPEGFVPLGPTKVDYGRGSVNLMALPHDVRERVHAGKGKTPDGRSVVGMTPEQITAAFRAPQLALGDKPRRALPAPRVQGMGR